MRIKDSWFINNTAVYKEEFENSGTAAGVYYYCTKNVELCKLSFTGKNYFHDNLAHNQGGAFHWTVLEPQFTLDETLFCERNTALFYGDNFSCVP